MQINDSGIAIAATLNQSMISSSFEERFEIRARLGSGSFGVVYEAFDRYRNRSLR